MVRGATGSSAGYGLGAAAVACATVAFGLYRRRIPAAVRAVSARVLEPPVAVLKTVHSGIAGDSVMWITVGTASSAAFGL